jgi:indolepyruvate ferredoxin oxidoreductase
MERQTDGFTHMGAEGANWIGEELFSTRQHVFQNVGDGTYSHSGLMAIRAAKAAETTVTFKILFNDAVALTGGQAPEGNLSVFSIAKDLAALDVTAIHVVTDEPEKYSRGSFPASVVVHHRDELELVQRKIAKLPGVTAIIYDQTCAAEKRRRRKRGTYPDPDRRVFINDRVCEGCGDCGIVSNCVAIQPKDTFFGRKRKIDQSSCNKDFSCLDGFCPSFVTVEGGSLRKTQHEPVVDKLPDPILPLIQTNYSILVTGVGGTGVVTIGAILAMAAHIEGKGCGVLDMSGLAQKGGAVYSHVRLANSQADLNAIRIGADGADLLLGCDIAVSGTAKTLAALHSDRTNVIANTYELMPGTFTRDGNYSLPVARVIKEIGDKIPAYRQEFFDATRLATELCGDSIASNMLMLGFAYQRGNIPISADAIEQAIELNGTAVAMNKAAFGWGRCAAIDLASVQSRIDATPEHEPASLSETIDRYQAELQQYQSRKYARSYRKIIDTIADKEGDMTAVVLPVVAEQLYRLMAIKDEYEVARLFAADEFKTKLALTFDNWRTLKFHLAPPLLARRDPVHGHLKKREFGAWILPVFNAMSRFRRIRNTVIDPFSYTAERRQERKLLADYQADIAMAQDMLTPDNQSSIAAFLSYPEQIKGFGHVKQAAIKSALHRRDLQLAILHGTDLTAGADVAA